MIEAGSDILGERRDSKVRVHLDHVKLMFEDCMKFDKSDCLYPNVRAHWTDVRRSGYLQNYANIISTIDHMATMAE